MARKTAAAALAGLILASGSTSSAQEYGAVHGGGHHCRPGFSCKTLCDWLTYHPLPYPKECHFRFNDKQTPPLYTYLVGLYGPRSPALGFPVRPAHPHDNLPHGAMPHEGQLATPPAALPTEEDLPTPRNLKQAPLSSSTRTQGVAPTTTAGAPRVDVSAYRPAIQPVSYSPPAVPPRNAPVDVMRIP